MKVIIDFKTWQMGYAHESYKFHLIIPHLFLVIVSFCFDDHVHDVHLISSGCNTQSRLTLLLRIYTN